MLRFYKVKSVWVLIWIVVCLGVWPFGRAWMEDTAIQFFKSCVF